MTEPRQIKIEEATREELLKFANENLQLSLHHKLGDGKILAAIRQAYSQDFITLYGEPDGPSVEIEKGSSPNKISASIRRLAAGSSKNDPKVRMFVNEAEGAGGQRPVFVSVNNVPMLIPRGEEMDVPYRYYLALKASISTVYEQDENTYEVHGRDVPAFPFQVVRLPTDKEMQGWNKQEHESQYPDGQAPAMEAVG